MPRGAAGVAWEVRVLCTVFMLVIAGVCWSNGLESWAYAIVGAWALLLVFTVLG